MNIAALPQHLFDRINPEPTTGCWLWAGHIQPKGYGTARNITRRLQLAHRLIYELMKGPIPEGLTIDHLCRVRSCVNPDHMEPVTNRVNILRGYNPPAIQARRTHCPRGHSLANAYKSKGHRMCRTCQLEKTNARSRRKTLISRIAKATRLGLG